MSEDYRKLSGREITCPVQCPNKDCNCKTAMVQDGAGYNNRGPVVSYSCMECHTFIDINMNVIDFSDVTNSFMVRTCGEVWICGNKEVYDLRAEWSLMLPIVRLSVDYRKNGFEKS